MGRSRFVLLGLMAALGLVAAAVAAMGASAASSTYTATDLGSLGFGVTDGLAINARGQVTGYSYSSKEFEVTCPPQKYGRPKHCYEHEYHAFVWSNGTMTDLGTLGGHFSQGVAINLSGEVVGWAQTSGGASDGFLWDGRRMVDLGSFRPSGINDSGVISGSCASGPCVDSNGKFTQLPNPPGESCGAGPINNSGQVLGGCGNAQSYERGALWTNGTPVDLGTLGGPQTGAGGLNNLGQVVGWSQTSTDADDGFLWSNGTMTDLGLSFYAAAINDNDVVVGGNEIYSNGTLQDLNNLTPAGSPQITYATAINDNGQIVAEAGGPTLLLTPN